MHDLCEFCWEESLLKKRLSWLLPVVDQGKFAWWKSALTQLTIVHFTIESINGIIKIIITIIFSRTA